MKKGAQSALFAVGNFMPLYFSVYLDLVRVIAAFLVFTGHGPKTPFLERWSEFLHLGHDSVIVFFVLSGYVISYAVDKLEKNWFSYVVNRMARILPVAITALILAFVLDSIGSSISTEHYPRVAELRHDWWWYFPLSLAFLNQAWWLNIFPFSDGAYWSLSYEVWDYVIFGILTFTTGSRRLLLAGLVFMIMGLKFILMLPVWYTGVILYKLHKKYIPSGKLAIFLAVIPMILYVACKPFNPSLLSYHWIAQPFEESMHHGLDGANNFPWDYLVALFFGLHIFAIRGIDLKWLSRPFLANSIRKAASYTYSLYLYHMPMLAFLLTMVRGDMNNALRAVLIDSCIVIFVVILAHYSEHRKMQARKVAASFVGWVQRLFDQKITSFRLRKMKEMVMEDSHAVENSLPKNRSI